MWLCFLNLCRGSENAPDLAVPRIHRRCSCHVAALGDVERVDLVGSTSVSSANDFQEGGVVMTPFLIAFWFTQGFMNFTLYMWCRQLQKRIEALERRTSSDEQPSV
jgi:hypothetical protein